MLLAITVGLWSVGFLLAGFLRRRGKRPDRFADETGIPPGAEPVKLSIIIPARNEAHNLPRLLRSIAAQAVRPHELIVVDDGSTDGTAQAARALGAVVVPSQPLPPGWRGKTWACHQGAQTATGGLLLFLDADTWFEPGGLDGVLRRYRGGAFSAGPYHIVPRLYEQLSLFFNFNMTAGTVPGGLFGQMLLVDRTSYDRAGGHQAVRGKILENFHLAGRFREVGVPVQSVGGRNLLSFRMYPNGVRELVEGWTKGFASGAGQTPRVTLLLLVAWMTGLMLAPLGAALGGSLPVWTLVYGLCAAQVGWLGRQVGTFGWFGALLYPAPLVFFFAIFAWSAAKSGKQVTWKGREILAD